MVAGKGVKIEVKAAFEGISKRPKSFEVDWYIDGNYNFKEFLNQ